jgi:hypothetical protein
MKITLPVANQQTLTFSGFDELAKHYSTLANGYLKEDNQPKAMAYASVAWQLSPSNGFRIELDVPQGWHASEETDGKWSAYKGHEFRAGQFGSKEHAEEWIEKYTNPPLKLLKIKFCAGHPARDEYMAGDITIHQDDLPTWIFEQIRNGQPLLITDMDEVDA